MVTTTYKAGERPRIQVATGVWKDPVLTKINGKTAYFRSKFIVGELAIDQELVTIIRHGDGTYVLEGEQWPPLTPYDTGERAQPSVWVSADPRRPAEHEHDRYGKVDFEDCASDTICTIWVEGTDDGESVVHIQNYGTGSITRIEFDPNGEDTEPEFVINEPSQGGTEGEQP